MIAQIGTSNDTPELRDKLLVPHFLSIIFETDIANAFNILNS